MTKQIETVVDDIYEVLSDREHKYSPENTKALGEAIAATVVEKLGADQAPRLRFSNIGETCDRKLWYQKNKPEKAEPLPPWARMKFLFGDVIEAIVLFLAKEAGHSVTGEQTTMELHGITGKRDGVIDGVTSDVKSASTYSLNKFKDHLTPAEDAFGYLDQVGAYTEAGKDDPLVTDKERFGFLAVDKTLGHIVLDLHSTRKDANEYFAKRIQHKAEVIGGPSEPPRGFSDEDDGKSGNRKLGTKCSYCEFRKHCWPGLRTFGYSNGPRYLTKVAREPDVPEIKY